LKKYVPFIVLFIIRLVAEYEPAFCILIKLTYAVLRTSSIEKLTVIKARQYSFQ